MTLSPTTTLRTLSNNGGSAGRRSDPTHFETRVLLAPDEERRVLDRTELPGLYPASKNTLEASEADAALSRNRTPRLCRDRPTRHDEEHHAGSYFHSSHS